MKNKKLSIEEDFSLARQYHKEKKFKDAENLYKKILDIDSNHIKSIFLLWTCFNIKKLPSRNITNYISFY